MNTLFGFALLAILGLCPKAHSVDIYDSGVTEADKAVVVDAHNNFRLQIANGQVPNQPRGNNLVRMEWDDKLAAEAQKVADLAKFEHLIVPDDRFPNRGSVGQNIFTSSSSQNSTEVDWSRAVQEWFNEYVNYNYASHTSTGVTGHYTQVVWADTWAVGCGYTYYYEDNAWFTKLYVCNYGPGGNYEGVRPYQTGSSGCENLCSHQ